MTIGYLGLGSNVGDRRAEPAGGDRRGSVAHGASPCSASSSTYDTDPVGEILDQPSFLNACLRIETDLDPEALLDACKAVEREMGRAQPGRATSATGRGRSTSTCSSSGDATYASERLTLPHEQVLARRFVLIPLLELDFELETPDGARLSDALAALPVEEGVRREGPPLTVPGGA